MCPREDYAVAGDSTLGRGVGIVNIRSAVASVTAESCTSAVS